MPVYIGSNSLIPAPFVEFTRPSQSTPDGTKLGKVHNITITGTLVAYKGSPQGGSLVGAGWGGPYSRFWTLSGYPADESLDGDERQGALQRKQQALRAAFAQDGQWLEWQPWDGSSPVKCQPRLKDIRFPQGIWYDTCEYVIELEADQLYLDGADTDETPFHDELVSSANESWSFDEAETPKTFRVTHTVNAVGKKSYSALGAEIGEAWQQAKDFVYRRLSLGFTGTSTFSPIAGTTIFQSSSLASGTYSFASLSPYNYVRSENVDQLAGSYAVTENWTMASASGTDVYTVSTRKLVDENNTSTVVNIQGTIQGFSVNLTDYDRKYQNARSIWFSLQGTPLYQRANSYASGVTLNTVPVVANLDHDPINGRISYNYEFNDKTYSGDVIDEYIISKKTTSEDYRAVLTINGTIKGRAYETDTGQNQRWDRAKAAWDVLKVSNGVYNRVIATSFFSEITILASTPIETSVDFNEPEGVITYSYSFNDRSNTSQSYSNIAEDTFSVSRSYSREDGVTTYVVDGQVVGMRTNESGIARATKYNNAITHFDAVSGSMHLRVSAYYTDASFTTTPIRVELVRNPVAGTINYSYAYDTNPLPCFPGALSESITVSDENRSANVNVFASIPIIGRTAGPILQNMSTTKEKVRTIDIELVMARSGTYCNFATQLSLKPNTDSFISPLIPTATKLFRDVDSESWNWKTGRYARTVRYIYQ